MGTQVNVGDHIKIKIQIITCYQVLMITYGPVWSNVRRTLPPPTTVVYQIVIYSKLIVPTHLPPLQMLRRTCGERDGSLGVEADPYLYISILIWYNPTVKHH